MTNQTVFCIVRSRDQADRIVDRLKAENFSNERISVLFPDKRSTQDFAHEESTKAPEAAATGAGIGGILGGTLGWLAGIGALAIPGVGPFIAAGPLLGALSGLGAGAAVGGITGALVGMGIPEHEAKHFESRVKEGNILISVETDHPNLVARAKEIFREQGADDISSTDMSATGAIREEDTAYRTGTAPTPGRPVQTEEESYTRTRL